jgi:hypothetical protein
VTRPSAEAPIHAYLPDGGHVVVEFADVESRITAADHVVDVLVAIDDGSERDLEDAIRSEADELGLRTSTSGARHPTVMLVGPLRA